MPNDRLDLYMQIGLKDFPSKVSEEGEKLKAEKLERLKYSGGIYSTSLWLIDHLQKERSEAKVKVERNNQVMEA